MHKFYYYIYKMQSTPGFAQTPQFGIMLRVGRVCWKRSPMLDSIIAPAVLRGTSDIFDCKCSAFPSSRVEGHVCTRKWHELPLCSGLFQVVGNRCMSYRVYPRLETVCGEIEHRVMANLRLGGMDKELACDMSSRFVKSAIPSMQEFWKSLGPHLHLDFVKSRLRTIRKAGFTFVRIDRNPGRVILVCNALWLSIQRKVFLQNVRYNAANVLLSSDDEEYITRTIAEFQKFVEDRGGGKLFLKKPSEATRPRGYWTKNKRVCSLKYLQLSNFGQSSPTMLTRVGQFYEELVVRSACLYLSRSVRYGVGILITCQSGKCIVVCNIFCSC